MESIIQWIKGIIILFILLKVLLYLTADSRYYRYLHFFSGMMILLAVLLPLMGEQGMGELLLDKLRGMELNEALYETNRQAGNIDFLGEEYYAAEYDRIIKACVEETAKEYGFEVKELHADVSQEGAVEQLIMSIQEDRAGSNITISDIVIDAADGENSAYEYIYKDFRQELARTYGIAEEKIVITMKKG